MTSRNLEDIDQLFREGLNPAVEPVPFQEADWLNLQHRLERHEKRKRGIFWISRLGGVAALILLFLALRLLIPEVLKPIPQQAEVQQKVQPSEKVQPREEKIKEAYNEPKASSETKKMTSKVEPVPGKSLAENKYREEKPAEKPMVVTQMEKPSVAHDTLRGENFKAQKEGSPAKNPSKEAHPSQPAIANPPGREPSTVQEPVFADLGEPNEKPIAERPARKLALSVTAAPDYNGVNNLNNASMGNNFGLMVSYEIARNWSFSTGGIYAKKLYETGFSNYSPSRNIWTDYYPKSVNADCRVLDIPLNINYTFLHRKNSTLGIGSGISSYIMLKEDYRFTYAENDGNNPLAYQVVNKNQHWLSVLNFQANFDQRLSSRLSLGVQPYLKIPFQNIGFAGVKLQSFGMAVNLSYNFNL
ncbi:MAG TPA: hypothetical protein VGK10_09890 [Prolixibacteraceae bacterium]